MSLGEDVREDQDDTLTDLLGGLDGFLGEPDDDIEDHISSDDSDAEVELQELPEHSREASEHTVEYGHDISARDDDNDKFEGDGGGDEAEDGGSNATDNISDPVGDAQDSVTTTTFDDALRFAGGFGIWQWEHIWLMVPHPF